MQRNDSTALKNHQNFSVNELWSNSRVLKNAVIQLKWNLHQTYKAKNVKKKKTISEFFSFFIERAKGEYNQ